GRHPPRAHRNHVARPGRHLRRRGARAGARRGDAAPAHPVAWTIMARRLGRRPGKQDTRGAIVNAAREVFAEHGYDGTSIRMIAAAADVDPALVHHYFEGKDQLFLETVRPPVNPAELIPKLVAGGVDGLGERIVETFTGVWEHPVSGPAFEALLRHAFASRTSGRLVREFFAVHL